MNMIERQIEELEALKTAMQLDVDMGRVKAHGSIKNRFKVIDNAIDTIKTQSEKIHTYAMKPRRVDKHNNVYECGQCGFILLPFYCHCPNCGTKILWNAVWKKVILKEFNIKSMVPEKFHVSIDDVEIDYVDDKVEVTVHHVPREEDEE